MRHKTLLCGKASQMLKNQLASAARKLPLAIALLSLSSCVFADDDTLYFDIDRFVLEGNSLLGVDQIETTLAPFTGKQQELADINNAIEALQQRYLESGFSLVWVVAPEQDLDQGVVILRVVEAQVGNISINGNDFFDDENVRASLPSLNSGTHPRIDDISVNVQLANQNPSKQVDVTLRPGTAAGFVDAAIEVIDEEPFTGFLTLDNTGNDQTGDYRLGVGLRHANLFNSDHIFTLSYISSPGNWSNTSLYSASYRLPLYSKGDSLDFVAAYSDVSVGTVQTVAGGLEFAGQGTVYSFRYNQLLPRKGEYSHQVLYGIDFRAYENQCSLGEFGEAGCGPAALDVTVTPISVAYSGNWANLKRVSNFYIALSKNVPHASNGHESDFNAIRPSPTGGTGAPSNYHTIRAGTSMVNAFSTNWQVRAALSVQYTPDALVSGEQFGLTGATSVRGFLERETARDKGQIVNLEVYSPNFAGLFLAGESNMRGLLFYDLARGSNNALSGESERQVSIASVGAGIRWNAGRNFNLRFDLSRIVDGDSINTTGNTRGHISIFLGL